MMRSVKWSVKGWKATAVCLAVVIVIVVQALGLGTGWSQEISPPRLDENFTKQEKIYRSRGADIPIGYVTGRGLADYAEVLPTGFCDTLGKLGSSDRWLDIGAGQGQAILDYYAPEDHTAPAQKCGRSAARAVAVALSIEDRRTDKWRAQAAISGDRLRYLTGKRLRQYSADELGKFQIITDVYGGFSYTEDLSGFLGKVLSLLETGGVFYSLVPGVHLEDGKDKLLGTWYLTELENAIGRPEKVCSWLKKTACVQVTCESKSDWERPTELINIRKVCSDVSVTPMKLLEYNTGTPPGRRFQLEQ